MIMEGLSLLPLLSSIELNLKPNPRESLKDTFEAPDNKLAKMRLEMVIEKYRLRYPDLARG